MQNFHTNILSCLSAFFGLLVLLLVSRNFHADTKDHWFCGRLRLEHPLLEV